MKSFLGATIISVSENEPLWFLCFLAFCPACKGYPRPARCAGYLRRYSKLAPSSTSARPRSALGLTAPGRRSARNMAAAAACTATRRRPHQLRNQATAAARCKARRARRWPRCTSCRAKACAPEARAPACRRPPPRTKEPIRMLLQPPAGELAANFGCIERDAGVAANLGKTRVHARGGPAPPGIAALGSDV